MAWLSPSTGAGYDAEGAEGDISAAWAGLIDLIVSMKGADVGAGELVWLSLVVRTALLEQVWKFGVWTEVKGRL